MDALWDPQANLLWYELSHAPAHLPRRHMVRETGWYCLGLLQRAAPGDVERANRALREVLAQQYLAPARIWHGTWARAPEDAPPRDGAVIWRHYDPNWRQFIGATLLIIQRTFATSLSAENARAINSALRQAVEGEPPDRVDARYTNIAMLRAWLDVEAGELLCEPQWIERGEALARAVLERYEHYGALDEFNSPTYYGVDLLAAALWARRSTRLAQLGDRIESLLWHDIASFYHAGLRNLCGPYARSYGMALEDYVGLVSLWMKQRDPNAPLPHIDAQLEHGHDLCLAPFVELLGTCIPDELHQQNAFGAFAGERQLARRLPNGVVATAWMTEHLMIGGFAGSKVAARDQFHPATAHWRDNAGNLQWLRLRSAAPLHATATRYELHLQLVTDQQITIEHSGGEAVLMPGEGELLLPGIRVSVAPHENESATSPEVAPAPAAQFASALKLTFRLM